jgi:predicted dehydrogenase
MMVEDVVSPVRLGVVGAGALSSRRIYPCLHSLPVSLAAVCDLDRARAEQAARWFGGEAVYTDYREMLAGAELDGVIVCVDPAQHHRLALDALRAGLPVYTEKPPAVRAADAFEMLAASRRAGTICMTGFKKRFAPAYQKAKAAIMDAAFGAPTLLSIDYCCGPTYRNDPSDPRSQFLLDFCIHIIDLSRYLFGEVAEVIARAKGEAAYAVTLLFRNGALGTLAMSSQRAWDVSCEKVELTGGPGQFITCSNSVEMTHYSTPAGGGSVQIRSWHSPSFSTAGADSLRETGFLGELEEFVACVRDGREPESSISSAAETMRLYEAIGQAAREGRPVVLDRPAEGPS